MSDTLVRDVLAGATGRDEPEGALAPRVVDHIRFHVGNVRQAAHYYTTAFGLGPVAYRGPETGEPELREYVLRSGSACFVLAGEVLPGTPVGRDVAEHGDAVADIALTVPDLDDAVGRARSAGARVVEEPHDVADDHGTVRLATLVLAGGARHVLVDRGRYRGPFLPGFAAVSTHFRGKPAHHPQHYVEAVDHWAGAAGPGVRHIALVTCDIVRAVRAMTEMGVEFADPPEGHHESLADRVGETRVFAETLRELRIQAHRDADGYLLQAFTTPVQDRPPLCFELVERHGARGVGAG
jgi:4-hydroxyphenylpyruvate dioxygenase-like putative hemolysin